MKKNILVFLTVFSGLALIGCKEKTTNLDKNIINTAYNNCYINLSSSLKSPSSLRVQNTSVAVYAPFTEDISHIYRLYRKNLIKDNQIDEIHHKEELRFRILGVKFNYEAQNSFGVYLPNSFECSYMYKLNKNESSPSQIELFRITSADNEIQLDTTIDNFTDGSNIKVNGLINKIIGDPQNESFNDNDKKIFSEIMTEHKNYIHLQEVEKFKKAWNWGNAS